LNVRCTLHIRRTSVQNTLLAVVPKAIQNIYRVINLILMALSFSKNNYSYCLRKARLTVSYTYMSSVFLAIFEPSIVTPRLNRILPGVYVNLNDLSIDQEETREILNQHLMSARATSSNRPY